MGKVQFGNADYTGDESGQACHTEDRRMKTADSL
jgi:hypothetical protein